MDESGRKSNCVPHLRFTTSSICLSTVQYVAQTKASLGVFSELTVNNITSQREKESLECSSSSRYGVEPQQK